MIRRRHQEHLFEVRRLILRSTEDEDLVICCRIIFQVFLIGLAIREFITGSGTEWSPLHTAFMSTFMFGCLIIDGVELIRTWRNESGIPTYDLIV
jgi:hypothetical protein